MSRETGNWFRYITYGLLGVKAMFGTGLRYFLKYPIQTLAAVASDPLEAWTVLQDNHAARREEPIPQDLYEAEDGWQHRLHDLLGVPWPCEANSEFWALWPEVIGELQAKGIRVGPESFKYWNDGDAGLVRAIWCLTRHLRPRNVVETGVAHGLTSRFILEALERNAVGHLWSIDRPPVEQALRAQIGIAVGDRYPHRWTYIKGSSRRRLPAILSQLGEIDLFIHDSMHSERNVRFEVERAWEALRPGGAIVVDDIDANRGFRTVTQALSGHQSMICEAEPLHPDLRRFNQKGLFGIILKEPTKSRIEC
jgi:predicted O-methyltransferase YrrM